MRLTLITPYRDRPHHLTNQLAWWKTYALKQAIEWIVVEVTAEPSKELESALLQHHVRYLHLACDGPFHKTKALNFGLKHSTGALVTAFDVDLIPLQDTLEQHCFLAEKSPYLLVTGYRLMAQTETVDLAKMAQVLEQATIGPEDQPSALRKHLLKGERFGVMPLFWRDRLLSIGGWDETFIGWGAEDQDMIERYLTPEQTLCRCHELIYLHLKHGEASGWNCKTLTARNRDYYYHLRNRLSEADS